jgi:hypothetical protein
LIGLALAVGNRLLQSALVAVNPNLRNFMSLELELAKFPKDAKLKDGSKVKLRPLKRSDEKEFHALFQTIPEQERMFIKHRVTDIAVIREWCEGIDLGRNLPLLAVDGNKILGVATLHQQLGGWKRHIGRVDIARATGLEKVEAEFIGGQTAAIHMFAMLGFSELLRLDDYVKDMQAIKHDYVLMGLDLTTDEEYTSAAG